MKLIPQTVELLKQEDWKKQIEIAARTCYKSEDKIADGTADKMLERLINSKHYAMLEHGTIYLHYHHNYKNSVMRFFDKYHNNPYSRAKINYEGTDAYITTNYRVLVENGWLKDLELYRCEPTDNHVKRYTLRIVTSIGIVRELLRHRVFSFANESTRYCNYSKDKFDNELTFILPSLYNGTCKEFRELASLAAMGCQIKKESEHYANLAAGLMFAESVYITLTDKYKVSPQFAREVLPLCTKSELIMTGFEDDWDRFLELRLEGVTGKPHPDMLQLASMIKSSLH